MKTVTLCDLTEQNPERKTIRIKVQDEICIYSREDISEKFVSGLEVTWSVIGKDSSSCHCTVPLEKER